MTSCRVPVIFTVNLLLILTLVLSLMADDGPSFTPSETETPRFNRMVVDKHTGRVYIGAVNWIYQLQPDLELEIAERTGPYEDKVDCSGSSECTSASSNLTDNVNKVLVIDYSNKRLLTCGSLFHGLCNVHELSNISHITQVPDIPVAAGTPDASTFAFIAPGPPEPYDKPVLYVGRTYTSNDPFRFEVPAVSSRSLEAENMLNVASVSLGPGTRVHLNSLYRERYPVNYVYGFASGDFSYFLTTQKKSVDNPFPYVSKLVRICQKDNEYFSYTEIPIECKVGDGVQYNLVQSAYLGKAGLDLVNDLGIRPQENVLYAVFSQSRSDDNMYDKPSNQSALCVYSLRAIQRKFQQNIQNCFSGNGERGLEYITPSMECTFTHFEITEDFCGLEVNTPLGGEMPIVAQPVISYDSTLLTAVLVTPLEEFTVAFLGTSTGHLLKVVVETAKNAFQYSDLEVDKNSPVNADLLFDPNKEHIYVMTERKVKQVKVQACHLHKSCSECLGQKDPYCGWCTLENKCTLQDECPVPSLHPVYWQAYHRSGCTIITNVDPAQTQITTARMLRLSVDYLPHANHFTCNFTIFNKSLTTSGRPVSKGITCPTPHSDYLPSIPPEKDHFTAILSVKKIDGPEFGAINFTFFDCTSYSSCTECVTSPFPCDWCIDGHRCTHDINENCRNDIIVTGINQIGPSIRPGPNYCPSIVDDAGLTEIIVSHKSHKIITVKVKNIAVFIARKRIVCQFVIEGQVTQVPAQLLGDAVYCERMEFMYNSALPNVSARFDVVWERRKPLDNPKNIHVLIYKCDYMAHNCGHCLTSLEKYHCGWCVTSQKCQAVSDDCGAKEVDFLDRDKTCPDPQITDFHPRSGPLEGGTTITITGINLGKTFADIKDAVAVAGIPCLPDSSEYIPTSRIVCEIQMPEVANLHEGPVIVKISDFLGESDTEFSYVNPNVKSISPTIGPQSGGTRVNITGDHLNAGNKIEAFIGNLPCKITSISEHWAECVTSQADELQDGDLRMTFDNAGRKLNEIKFRYVEDPIIKGFKSYFEDPQTTFSAIPSGGIQMVIDGERLQSIQNPQVSVSYQDRNYVGHCSIESAEIMKCISPKIPIEEPIDAETPKRLELGFLLDGVTKYHNFSIFLYPHPEYDRFEGNDQVKFLKSDYLSITGKNLNLGCDVEDVAVEIGTAFCNVTSLSRSQLTCRPPATQPPAIGLDGQLEPEKLPEVVVIIGGTLRFKIGYLTYKPIPEVEVMTTSSPDSG